MQRSPLINMARMKLWVFCLLLWCPTCLGEMSCEMQDEVDFKYPASTATDIYQGVDSLEDCKTACLRRNDCFATEFRSVLCFIYTEEGSPVPSTGTTVSVKECTEEEEDGEDFSGPPTSTGEPKKNCQVVIQADTDGTAGSRGIPVSPRQVSKGGCQRLCQVTSGCRAYHSKPGECSIYDHLPKNLVKTGGVVMQREECENGLTCCFTTNYDSQEDDLPNASEPLLVLQDSTSTCAQLCLALKGCAAVSFHPIHGCKLFPAHPEPMRRRGYYLYTKQCDGPESYNITYSNECLSATSSVMGIGNDAVYPGPDQVVVQTHRAQAGGGPALAVNGMAVSADDQARSSLYSLLQGPEFGAHPSMRRLLQNTGNCVMQERVNFKYPDSVPDEFVVGGNVEGCKTICLGRTDCFAAEPRSTLCLIFKGEATPVPATGTTVYVKECTEVGCTMGEQANKDGSSPAITLSSSASSCESLCAALPGCLAYSHVGGQCSTYNSVPSTSASDGSVFGQKTQCDDGTSCCFITQENQAATGAMATVSLSGNSASCSALCEAVSGCVAASFGGSSCKIFTTSPSTSDSSGVTFFTKTCTGADTGSQTYTDICNAGVHLRQSQNLLWILLITGFLYRML